MIVVDLLLLCLQLIGHLAIWCALYNQIHAQAWSRTVRKVLEKLIYIAVVAGGLALIWSGAWVELTPWISGYRWLCLLCSLFVAVRWLWWRFVDANSDVLVGQRCQLIDLGADLPGKKYAGLQANLLSWIPGNQSLKLSIEHRILKLPNWPVALDGLVIAQLSDLHLNGKMTREYFRRVAQQTNQCDPDIICLTGDVVEQAHYLSWLPDILGTLTARFGKYYILGNHDLRIRDERQLRSAIEATGFQRLTGNWLKLTIRGAHVMLAGNELPWYSGAENLRPTDQPGPKIILSHSPDQFAWAQAMQADLVLAGHTHGGQVRLPLIGPIIVPSVYGVRYASGLFEKSGTVMFVNRGLSGDETIRWNCPPELSILKINSPDG